MVVMGDLEPKDRQRVIFRYDGVILGCQSLSLFLLNIIQCFVSEARPWSSIPSM